MIEDIEACKRIGVQYSVFLTTVLMCSGVVIGCLTKDGKIDMEKNRRLIEAAGPLRFILFFPVIPSVTFHRAIDMTVDPLEAVSVLFPLKFVSYRLVLSWALIVFSLLEAYIICLSSMIFSTIPLWRERTLFVKWFPLQEINSISWLEAVLLLTISVSSSSTLELERSTEVVRLENISTANE